MEFVTFRSKMHGNNKIKEHRQMEVYCCFLHYMWSGILFDRKVLEVTDACFKPGGTIKALKLTMKRYWNLKNTQVKEGRNEKS